MSYSCDNERRNSVAKKKLFLSVCCGPCSTTAIERLKDEYEVVLFFFGSNIQPFEEYVLRRKSVRKLAEDLKLELVVAPYSPDEWLSEVKGLEAEPESGKRCELCYKIRMIESCKWAKDKDIPLVANTLTLSPHKDADLINKIGREVCEDFGMFYLDTNFKKEKGYPRSIELSKKYGLYRQNYCGCLFSIRD